MKDDYDIYRLLAKYLAGEADEDEQRQVLQWRYSSPRNKKEYARILSIWESAGAGENKTGENFSKEQVWEMIERRSVRRPSKPGMLSPRRLAAAVSLAASIAVVCGLGVGYILFGYGSGMVLTTVEAPPGQKGQVWLPDSTHVWLNSGSRITYGDFKNKRSVSLTGEAYFDVTRSARKGREFTVHTDRLDVVVKGTAFEVSCYEDASATSVSLERGSVELKEAGSGRRIAMLTPGLKAVVDNSSGRTRTFAYDPAVDHVWINGRMVFQDADPIEVFAKMEKWYGVEISVEKIPPMAKYWFTVQTESLTELLGLINILTPINYTINGEEVNIRYR